MCLEAIDFELAKWPRVLKWYENFKSKHPELWEITDGGMKEIRYFADNPPDLSHMEHPIHPIRKIKN